MDVEERMQEQLARAVRRWNKNILAQLRARWYAVEQHYAELAAADKRSRARARKYCKEARAKARRSPKVAPARTPSVFDLVDR